MDADLQRQVRRGRERVDGGLQQRVADGAGMAGNHGVAIVEVLDVEHHGARARRGPDRDLHAGGHGDVEDPPRPAEPGIGPPPVVTDPDGRRRLDHLGIIPRHPPRHPSRTSFPDRLW